MIKATLRMLNELQTYPLNKRCAWEIPVKLQLRRKVKSK